MIAYKKLVHELVFPFIFEAIQRRTDREEVSSALIYKSTSVLMCLISH